MDKKKIYGECKDLGPNDSTFIKINSSEYFETNMVILKNTVKEGASVIYVTMNMTYESLLKRLKKKNINTRKMFFIDCISQLISETSKKKKVKNVIYAQNPQDLNNLGMIISEVAKALPNERKVLLFNSVSDLLIYNSPGKVKKFLSKVTKKIKKSGVNGIFLSTEKKVDSSMEKQIKQYFDKTMDFTGGIEKKFARLIKR